MILDHFDILGLRTSVGGALRGGGVVQRAYHCGFSMGSITFCAQFRQLSDPPPLRLRDPRPVVVTFELCLKTLHGPTS